MPSLTKAVGFQNAMTFSSDLPEAPVYTATTDGQINSAGPLTFAHWTGELPLASGTVSDAVFVPGQSFSKATDITMTLLCGCSQNPYNLFQSQLQFTNISEVDAGALNLYGCNDGSADWSLEFGNTSSSFVILASGNGPSGTFMPYIQIVFSRGTALAGGALPTVSISQFQETIGLAIPVQAVLCSATSDPVVPFALPVLTVSLFSPAGKVLTTSSPAVYVAAGNEPALTSTGGDTEDVFGSNLGTTLQPATYAATFTLTDPGFPAATDLQYAISQAACPSALNSFSVLCGNRLPDGGCGLSIQLAPLGYTIPYNIPPPSLLPEGTQWSPLAAPFFGASIVVPSPKLMLLEVSGYDPAMNCGFQFVPLASGSTSYVHALMGPLVDQPLARGPRGGILAPLDIVAAVSVANTRTHKIHHTATAPLSLTYEAGLAVARNHHGLMPIVSTFRAPGGLFWVLHSIRVEGPPRAPVQIGTTAPVVVTAVPILRTPRYPLSSFLGAPVLVEVPTGYDADATLLDLSQFKDWIVTISWAGQVHIADA